ncbi:hypothetical protein POL68_23780 [Stigmatella sp. ncwal1]|uniref:Lipoprotein n=1 Tax=Stigmatella ashevillensis TaxID=2995309 RepID=A0ABT5DGQ1_9BACT|nr:hypothetical protein [Stigmatella ashevillena]MDC0711512.1 hypothetical protein [Stigmatella ashevillena]
MEVAVLLRQVSAVLLAVLAACAGTPRMPASEPHQAELAAIQYEVRVLTVGAVTIEPVEVDAEDFQKALRKLIREVPPSERPRETASWLLERELQAEVLAEVESGRVVRMVPSEEGSPLSAPSNAALVAQYERLCAEHYQRGDCIGLLADGPRLDREDRRTLALAFAFGSVLNETSHSLRQMVSPQAVLSLLIGTAMVYFMLWAMPEPVSKGVAALMTLAFIAWLGVDTVWSLMNGWAQLVQDSDRATTFDQLKVAGARFSAVMGENTARVVMLVVTAALSGGAAHFSQKLSKLPGFERAAEHAQAQGASLSMASALEAVAVPAEGTVTLMVRSLGRRTAAAVEARAGATTIIRHQGGNRQVFINGQRWHVPANRLAKDIPTKDPVGDQLQAAAREVASRWHPSAMSRREAQAIESAKAKGEYWKANLLEREARGRFVHREVARQFENLKWSSRGVDAIDPTTGYRYELLTGTDSNMGRHGRRIAEELFRMIGF